MKKNLRSQLSSLLGSSKQVEAHHIIPLELWDTPVIQAAGLDGFHINDIINAIGLESPDFHNGVTSTI